MDQSYWVKQTESLYPELEWETPEQKSRAGKLVILGGNAYDFSDVALSYTMVQGEGIGSVKVLMPKSVEKLIPDMPDISFVANTHAGSFAKEGLPEIKTALDWSEGLFLPGQLGRNSETAQLLQSILGSYQKPIIATKDAINYLYTDTREAMDNANLIAVLSLSQLQKLLKNALWPTSVQFSMNSAQLAELLHDITKQKPLTIITLHNEHIFIAKTGQVSTTAVSESADELWQLEMAAAIATKTLHFRHIDSFKALNFAVFSTVNEV